jgi:hypothetical protein
VQVRHVAAVDLLSRSSFLNILQILPTDICFCRPDQTANRVRSGSVSRPECRSVSSSHSHLSARPKLIRARPDRLPLCLLPLSTRITRISRSARMSSSSSSGRTFSPAVGSNRHPPSYRPRTGWLSHHQHCPSCLLTASRHRRRRLDPCPGASRHDRRIVKRGQPRLPLTDHSRSSLFCIT